MDTNSLPTTCCVALLFSAASALGDQTIEYSYDALGRLVQVEDSVNGDSVYDYDDAGNRTQTSDGGGSGGGKNR